MKIPLRCIAHTRSGDKGNTSNIAVFAFEPAFYPVLLEQLSAQRLKAHYGSLIKGEVKRYRMDNIEALNFVCEGALGGGVSRSLYLDNYGKALSSAVHSFEIDLPDCLLALVDPQRLRAAGIDLSHAGVHEAATAGGVQ